MLFKKYLQKLPYVYYAPELYIPIVSTTDISRIRRTGPVIAATAEMIITAAITAHSITGARHASPHLAVIACRYR